MESLDTEANAVITTEKSRIVKIFLVKYKCFLILAVLIVCICEYVFIMSTKIMSNEVFTKMVLQYVLNNNRTQ